MVWEWFGNGLEMVWEWFGNGLEMVWKWFGNGLEMVWKWFGNGLEMVWKWRLSASYCQMRRRWRLSRLQSVWVCLLCQIAKHFVYTPLFKQDVADIWEAIGIAKAGGGVSNLGTALDSYLRIWDTCLHVGDRH
jgi:hypothetical protein